ncbi:GIY-YIG nuclease family protein [Nitrosospira sp. NRS527]|uniref:GIY-YIG nuclease family protein n=1 Tax=Nitrosospira sp. NRS527 TaxID=155925 RepID=UPI001AF2167A|nr:GIY-YIG nuclease family protein [Nitrosospira sp. NRS527]BCT69489.1 hypothetical protein NNRS527_03113 [Nitrosospira sp. NRS527]
MKHCGYLYVLANSAMPGLVKVGKTTRTPSERAAELSGVTGLPSPFIVVYEQLFQDCNAAESFVHTHLAQNGFRISDNREFFNAPVNDIVRAIALAPGPIDKASPQIVSEIEDDVLEDDDTEKRYPWSSIFDEAESYYYGYEEFLQDDEKALRLFRRAAKLGSLPAYGMIARILRKGGPADQQKGLNALKEGAEKGSVYCYWEMGLIFTNDGNIGNAEKCFLNFVQKFPSAPDGQHLSLSERRSIFTGVGYLIYRKFKYGSRYPAFLDTFFKGKWGPTIVHHAHETQKHLAETQPAEFDGHLAKADFVEKFAKAVEYLNSLQGLPDKASTATDMSATEEKKGGFFARFFS